MSTYIYTPESNTFDSLSLVNAKDSRRLLMFTGASLVATWKPLSVRPYPGKQRGDFPSLAGHVPVFSERAVAALHPVIANAVEVLPLKSPGPELFAINVLTITDCLDEGRSALERDPSGNVWLISQYAFDPQCLEGKHIFKLRQAPLYKVFVSDEFKRCAQDSKLKGLRFREAA